MSDVIQEAIPHRPPMLLIDEIVAQSEDRIVCRKTFRADEFFFQGHYPQKPIVPGVILCECAMQAGAVLLSRYLQGTDVVPVATRLDEVRFKRMVQPGDTIEIDVQLDEQLSGAFFLTARVLLAGKPAVRFRFGCTGAAS